MQLLKNILKIYSHLSPKALLNYWKRIATLKPHSAQSWFERYIIIYIRKIFKRYIIIYIGKIFKRSWYIFFFVLEIENFSLIDFQRNRRGCKKFYLLPPKSSKLKNIQYNYSPILLRQFSLFDLEILRFYRNYRLI